VNPVASIYIDAMRLLAALVVFAHHLTAPWLNHVLTPVPWGREAVTLFFVMSGFVIAYVVDTRERRISAYASARLARLYSVIVPALVLTAILDPIGRALSPAVYASLPGDHAALRLLINLLSLQQSWNLTVIPLSNPPFWSLAYEFWYYVIFGSWALLRGRRRWLVIGCAVLLAGPRIVAHMPVWMLGVGAWHLGRAWQASSIARWSVFATGLVGLVVLAAFGNPMPHLLPSGNQPMVQVGPLHLFVGTTQYLAQDLVTGIAFAATLVAIQGCNATLRVERRWVGILRYCSGATFTIYLMHAPLMLFVAALCGVDGTRAGPILLLGGAVLLMCLVLSYAGERQVSRWRSLVGSLIGQIDRRVAAANPRRAG
jgi:peptidoglycan/LPS O-acetylase OafA/YrhL